MKRKVRHEPSVNVIVRREYLPVGRLLILTDEVVHRGKGFSARTIALGFGVLHLVRHVERPL
jgi:hypothetical protein